MSHYRAISFGDEQYTFDNQVQLHLLAIKRVGTDIESTIQHKLSFMIHNRSLHKTVSKNIWLVCLSAVLMAFAVSFDAIAQGNVKKILIDVAHGQKFWNDPNDMKGMEADFIQRVKYMTGEITKNAESVNAGIGYIKGKIKPADLEKCDILFIHIPSAKYDADEVRVINEYLKKGGSLFLAMDADYWSTLEQTGVNEIVAPSGITFAADSPDTLSGGYTKRSEITDKKLKVTFHGGRIVNGGTPFCYTNQSEAHPFGTYAKLANGGKIVAMGDGMASLYMTSWRDVNDYQCSEFMHEVFAWLID
jgi:hypothetical protein